MLILLVISFAYFGSLSTLYALLIGSFILSFELSFIIYIIILSLSIIKISLVVGMYHLYRESKKYANKEQLAGIKKPTTKNTK